MKRYGKMDFMTIGLLIILLIVFNLPFTVKIVEENLEYFLFIMGIIAALVLVLIVGNLSLDRKNAILLLRVN